MMQTQNIKHSNVYVPSVKFYTPYDLDMQTKNQSAAMPSGLITPQTKAWLKNTKPKIVELEIKSKNVH